MGWGRTLLLGDIGNRLDIEDTERDIASVKQELASNVYKNLSQDKQLQLLANENAELKLYLASLIQLLKSKQLITNEELVTMVNNIDTIDGKADGQYNGPIL